MKTDNLLAFDGEIYYKPHFFDSTEAEELFEKLVTNVDWQQEPVHRPTTLI